MTVFSYKAKKGPTEVVEGRIEAESEQSASNKLIEMGLFPVSVVSGITGQEPQITDQGSGIKIQGSGARVKVKARDVDAFTYQLASLVRSGVPILRALSLLSNETGSRPLKGVIDDLAGQVKNGRTLSETMAGYPLIFNPLYLNLVKSGEKSGSLDQVLDALAEYREKERETLQKIQAAAAYPALLLLVGVGSIFVMLTFFLPKIAVLFEDTRQVLPLPTRVLIGLSRVMSAHWFWFLIPPVVLAAYLGRLERGTKKKRRVDSLILHLPLLGGFVRRSEIAKFSRTFALLFKRGIIIHESLNLAAGTIDNEVLREQLEGVSRDIVAQGSTLSDGLAKLETFPKFAINMIAVGEEGGRLENSLAEITRLYEKDSEHALKIGTALMEPLLIFAIGSVMGFIVFSMLLPIFDMGMVIK